MKKRFKSLGIITAAVFLFGSISLWASANNAATVEEWNDFYNTMSPVSGGVKMFANASCKTGLNPDDLSFDLEFEKLTDLVDCWVAMGFNKTDAEMNVTEATSSGIKFLMRNAGGKLNIQAFKKIGDASIFHATFAANAVGTTKIHLYKDGEVYKIGFGSEAQTLTGVTAADFTNAEGKTFLTFTGFDQNGDAPNTRVWSVKNLTNSVYTTTTESSDTNGTTTTNGTQATTTDSQATTTTTKPTEPAIDVSKADGWTDFYSTITEVDGGVKMFGNVTCKLALDPDDLSFDLAFEKLSDVVDCWVTMSFMKTGGELNVTEGSSTGIKFLMRNSGGKLNIQAFKKIGDTNIFHDTFEANAIGTTRIRLYKDGSVYKIAVGGQVKALTGVTASDFTNADGKTFLGFAAFDADSDAPNNRVWSVQNMSNSEISGSDDTDDGTDSTDPTSNNPETGYASAPYLIVLSLVLASGLFLATYKRKRQMN